MRISRRMTLSRVLLLPTISIFSMVTRLPFWKAKLMSTVLVSEWTSVSGVTFAYA